MVLAIQVAFKLEIASEGFWNRSGKAFGSLLGFLKFLARSQHLRACFGARELHMLCEFVYLVSVSAKHKAYGLQRRRTFISVCNFIGGTDLSEELIGRLSG